MLGQAGLRSFLRTMRFGVMSEVSSLDTVVVHIIVRIEGG